MSFGEEKDFYKKHSAYSPNFKMKFLAQKEFILDRLDPLIAAKL